jgi:hypothetical protein
MNVRSVIRTLGVIPVVVGLTLTVSATTASADTKRVPLPNPDFTYTGGCTFPVFVHTNRNQEYATFTTLADGTVIKKVEGSLVVTYTNVNTGKAITVNISGPGVVTFFTNGTVTIDEEGLNGSFWDLNAQALFGLPGLELTSGHLQVAFDASGVLHSYSLTGHSVDGCALLS